jgi:uncharacterized membrane protein
MYFFRSQLKNQEQEVVHNCKEYLVSFFTLGVQNEIMECKKKIHVGHIKPFS